MLAFLTFNDDSGESIEGADVSDDESDNSECNLSSAEPGDAGGSDTGSDNRDDGDNGNRPTESCSGEEEDIAAIILRSLTMTGHVHCSQRTRERYGIQNR